MNEAAGAATVGATVGAREERVHGLDNLRAVAMLLGIVLHAGISFMTVPSPWPVRDVARHWSFDVTVGVIHGFRMQLFFFLAGFFARLLQERLGAWGFVKQRWVRIGVPFVAGMVMIMPMVGVLWFWGAARLAEAPELPFERELRARSIPTGHLWFLQYLLVFYGVAVAAAWVGRRLPAWLPEVLDRGFERWLRSWMRAFWMVPLTVVCLWNGPMWGEVEHAGLEGVLRWRVVGYYGLFFAVGWWLHRRKLLLGELSRFLK